MSLYHLDDTGKKKPENYYTAALDFVSTVYVLQIIQKIALYLVVFALSFLVTIVYSFPLDLLGSRYIFPKIQEKTGVTLSASSIGLDFPLKLTIKKMAVTLPGKKIDYSEDFDRVVIEPSLRNLLGEKVGTVKLNFADGALEIHSTGKEIEIEIREISLRSLKILKEFSAWKLSGALSGRMSFAIPEDSKKLSGSGELSAVKVKASNIQMLGIQFPQIAISKMSGQFKVEDGTVEIKKIKSAGPDVGINAFGNVVLAKPLSESALNISAKVTMTEKLLSRMEGARQLISLAQKEDGSIQIGITGSVGNNDISFR